MTTKAEAIAPIALTTEQAAQSLGIGRSRLREPLNRSEYPIPHFRHGSRTFIPARDLAEWASEEATRYSTRKVPS